jgi:hypothetical protein
MNKLKHTPGPWFLTTNTLETASDVAASIYGPLKNGGAPFICDVSKSAGEEAALYNARLMAAAPDLLNACIAALEAMKVHKIGDWTTGDLLIKAINKATE